LIAVPGIWDTQCGFKAFTAQAAQEIFGETRINGWGCDIEVLALSRRFGHKIGIVPAHWIDQAGTHVKSWDYFGTLREAIQVRWYLMTGAYNYTLPVVEAKK
jgi:dolichyl-phosphate beta-glucosyltransferase